MVKNKGLSWFILAMFLWTIASSIATPPAYASSKSTDINGHWAQSQIEKLTVQNIISGYPDGTFKPDKTVTRAEFASMVNQAFKFNKNATTSFIDIKTTDWFADQISRAKEAGYIAGYEDGSVKPNNNLSRPEAAVMMSQIVKANNAVSADSLNKFKDADKIPAWAREAIASIITSGIMSGYPDQTFKPQNIITRAEAAVTISLAMEKLVVQPAPTTPVSDFSR